MLVTALSFPKALATYKEGNAQARRLELEGRGFKSW